MIEKKFKNLEEQIEILKHKGLVIEDEDFAKEVLLRENYFFLSGYRMPFMVANSNKQFIEGTKFEELYSLFLFDRAFRNILFKNLLIIENNLKSITSYQLSKKYGYREKDYLKSKNFTSKPEKSRQVNDLIKKMKRQIRINGAQHTATQHYVSNYGYIPLWILVKVLSFGIVSEMFTILKKEDQQEICEIYHVTIEELTTYLPILANYRNLCAHEDIVYDNKTQRDIENTVYHQLLKLEKEDGEYKYGKNDLFALIIIMKQVLKYEDFLNMTLELERVIDNLSYNLKIISIDKILDLMGFPENWKELSTIERSVDIDE